MIRRAVAYLFFFSSRRRHTILSCDWSSDVCSSDRKSTRLNSSHTIISYDWSSDVRSEEHTSELQSHDNLVCRLLLEKKKRNLPRRPLLRHLALTFARAADRPRASAARVPTPAPLFRIQVYPPPLFRFFNDAATTEIYTLSLHDALPI